MDRSLLLVLLCLQVFLLITTFTSSDAAALVRDPRPLPPDLVQRRNGGNREIFGNRRKRHFDYGQYDGWVGPLGDPGPVPTHPPPPPPPRGPIGCRRVMCGNKTAVRRRNGCNRKTFGNRCKRHFDWDGMFNVAMQGGKGEHARTDPPPLGQPGYPEYMWK